MKSKKAQLGEQVMIFPFVLMLIVIGGGIAAGIYVFFSSGYDFRKVDADILNYKIQDCLTTNKINFNQDKALLEKEFFTVCNINQQIIKENFIIGIGKNSEVKLGIESDEVTCALSQTTAKNNPNYPICTTTFLNDFRITTGSKQQAQKQIT